MDVPLDDTGYMHTQIRSVHLLSSSLTTSLFFYFYYNFTVCHSDLRHTGLLANQSCSDMSVCTAAFSVIGCCWWYVTSWMVQQVEHCSRAQGWVAVWHQRRTFGNGFIFKPWQARVYNKAPACVLNTCVHARLPVHIKYSVWDLVA